MSSAAAKKAWKTRRAVGFFTRGKGESRKVIPITPRKGRKRVVRFVSGIFPKPLERRESTTLQEAQRAVDKIAKATKTKMVIIGGLKRKGESKDVDVIVFAKNFPKKPLDTDTYGIPLMKELGVGVDLFFPNRNKEKVKIEDYTSIGCTVTEAVPDYLMASYKPDHYFRLTDGRVGYLPIWGYVSKEGMKEVGKLKGRREQLVEQARRVPFGSKEWANIKEELDRIEEKLKERGVELEG
jgi:hypothetical protein